MSMNTAIVIATVCLCVFFIGVNAQFDHTDRNAASLSLVAAANNPQNGVSQFSATANDQVVGGSCRCNSHTVSNVRINNGPFNSGSYFEVSISHTVNASLNYFFGDPVTGYFDILDVFSNGAPASAIGAVGFCDPSAINCVFDYYCDIYPSDATLELLLCSDSNDNSLSDSINFYSVSVTQYVVNIQTIGQSRSLNQATNVVNTYAASNPGPSNFQHYYHQLQPTVAEAGKSSRLFIEAVNWAGATGSAYICVSFDNAVANTNSLSGVVFPGGDINGINIIPNSVFTNAPDGCTTYCQQGNINGATSSVVLSFDGCFDGCGFPDNIWIGVRPPSSTTGSTYTVQLRFRDFSVPELTDISSFVTEFDADITDNCDGNQGDFSCENYYEVINRPNVAAGQPGPYLAVEVFAVHDGSVAAFLTDGFLAGDESLCAGCPIFSTCSEVSPTANVPDCWLVVQPCQWSAARDWILTVEGLNQDDTNEAIEYGVRFDAGTWPLTSVTADEWLTGAPSFGEVLPHHYHHYQISFTDADLFDDSYFEVELYTFHEEDEIGFAWKYGSFADSGTCYGYDGLCTTATDCTSAINEDNTGFCRFSFLPCPIEVSYSDIISRDDGLKVAQLKAGTYYFAVWGLGGSDRYATNVHYTITWNLRRSLPLFDAVTVSSKVFLRDYTNQYYVTYPDDPTILSIDITISEVTNGLLVLYGRCGALAGDCPCWNADDGCTAGGSGSSYECSLSFSACSCPSRTFYFSIQDIGNTDNGSGDDGDGYFNFLSSASFTLTANIIRYPVAEITPIEISRSQVTITGLLSNTVDDVFPGSALDADFYWLSTTNIRPSNDALVIRLTGLVTNPSETSTDSVLRVRVAKGGIAYSGSCAPSDSCVVDANDFYNYGEFGVCDLVFQPCYAPDTCVDDGCTLQQDFASIAWDYEDIFYVTVSLTDSLVAVQYTLQLQVIDQTPLALTDSQPFYGYVGQDQYVHFSYNLPAGKSQNARLYVNLYQNWDKDEGVSLFVHHASGASPELAGNQYECLQHDFCDVCSLVGEPDDFCNYQVSPCVLSGQTGTYYLSVRGDFANYNQNAGQERSEFTLTVAVHEPMALLDNNAVGIPMSESIYDGQEYYYSVTVPTLVTGNIVGRILTIEVGSVIDGNLFFGITQLEPVNDCGCDVGANLITLDSNEWRRYPCELRSGDVYYITVSGTQNRNCDPVGYIVHARVYNVIQETITLSSVDTTVVGSYDTTTYQIGYNEWKTIKFTTNAVAGAVLNIDITQPNINSPLSKPIEARLSIGNIATRLGYNGRASVGPLPNDASCLANYVCTGELRTTCSIFVPSCALPQGTTTWFLTFTGEDLTVASESDPINISIRQINPQSVVTFPALSDYTTTSTSVSVSTTVGTINGSYGKSHFTTTSNSATGINAGDTLVISYSGNSQVDFFVSHGSETGFGCNADCLVENSSNPSCTFVACENIASAVWYVSLESFASTTGTFSVRRTASPTNSISVTPLSTLNTVTNYAALGTNQWRYHSINVPASSTSHYEIQITGGASFNDVVYVGTTSSDAVWLPGLVFDPLNFVNEFTLSSEGLGNICGGFNIVGIADTCCYDQDTSVFAIVGDVGAYNIEIVKVEFADGNVQAVNLPSVTTRTTTGGKVAWFSFNLPAGNDLWFELAVSSGQARLYLNKGALAGSDATSFLTDFGACWDNDDLIQQICPGFVSAGGFCDGFIPSDCYACLSENSGSTYYFAVIPDVDATYSLTVIGQTRVQTLNTAANNNLLFPSTGSQNIKIVDDTLDSSDFSVYSHFVWNFASSPYSIAQYIPVVDDPEVIDRFTYPYVQFVISNVVQIGTTNSADNLVDFFVNSGSLAGNSDCYAGRDITNGGSIVPCLENSNGAASIDAITGDITCSVLICDLSCPESVYFSVGRSVQDVSAISFSIGISNQFAQVADEIDIIPVTLNTNGFTINYSNAQSLNEVVYFRFTGPSVNNFLEASTQYFNLFLDKVIGVDSQLDVRVFSGNECTNFGSTSDLCSSLSQNEFCFLNYDPCGATEIFVDNDQNADFFMRVSRTSGSAATWGFTISGEVLTASAIDAGETSFTLTSAGASYVATKEIFNGDWHFYEFNVNNGVWGGYNTIEASVDILFCDDPVYDLEVYSSWFEDASGVVDVARSNRWPTSLCFVDNDLAPTSFSIQSWCNTWGGVYRLALYAEYGLQNYDDPVLGVNYPVVYEVSFDVVPRAAAKKIALNCDVAVNGPSYFEVRPDASNRGSQLEFFLTSENGNNARLYISKNANPFEESGNCAWGSSTGSIGEPFSTINGDYYCDVTGGDSCVIFVPVCEFDDDRWFVFVDAAVGAKFTLNVYDVRVYTPVVFLDSIQTYTTGGLADDFYYQYYNFVVDNSDANARFSLVLNEVSCSGCSLTAYLLEGPHGFASGTSDNGPHSQACGNCAYGDCACSDRSCSTTSNGYCTLFTEGCSVSDGTLYIGIISNGASDCPYEIQASTTVAIESFVENVEICTSVYCNDYYLLQSSASQTDFTENTVSLFITNFDGVNAINVYVSYGQVGSEECFDLSDSCAAGADCQYDLNCISGPVYVTVSSVECLRGATCAGTQYSISYTFAPITIGSVAVGGSISSQIAMINAQGSFFTSSGVSFSSNAGDACGTSCGIAFGPGQYYFYGAQGVTLSSFSTVPLSSSFSAVTFDTDYKTFSIAVPTGVDSFVVHLEDFNYPINGLDIAYSLSTVVPALDGCTPCAVGSSYITNAGCNNDAASLSFNCLEQTTYYLSLTGCSVDECEITFRIRVEFATPRTLISGDHNTAYTTITTASSCSAVTSFGYYTNVNGPFFVNLKQVGPSGDSATVTIRSADECVDSSCTAIATTSGSDASCFVQDGCNTFSCAEGLYYIDVNVAAGAQGSGLQLQVINQWVTLSGTATGTIVGSQKHFFQVPNAASALTFKLTVNSGPALRFIVFDGCGQNEGSAFSETKIAAFGDSYTWVPTFAKHSGASTYYVELFADFDASDNAEWARNDNTRSDTPTSYTLQVITGSGNCAAPPSTGFCADSSIAGVNVWSDITTTNVWKFVDPTLKDNEAQCLYTELSGRCEYPTDECRYWLKVFSCLETFPQCDADGFQSAMCVDVCQKVETACGGFASSYPFECCRDRYVPSGSGSTCFNIPPPPPPPPSFDDVDVSGESSFPPPIEVPVFPTIFATMPPASNFYTFSVAGDKEAEIVRQVANSASSVSVCVLLVLSVIAMLI